MRARAGKGGETVITTESQWAGEEMTRTLVTDLGFLARHDVIEGFILWRTEVGCEGRISTME